MGNAKFWYYPGGSLHEIDLGEGLSDLHTTPIRTFADAYTMSGTMFRQTQNARLQCRIILERFTSESVARELESMMAYLELGGSVSFCADADKAVAAYLTIPPDQGDTVLRHADGANLFAAFNSSAALTASDVVCVQGSNPGLLREFCAVSSRTTYTTTLSEAIRYDYPENQAILMRYRDFFPVLKMPEEAMNAAALTSDHRVSFTLDLLMVEDTSAIEALAAYTDAETLGGVITDLGASDAGNFTLDEAINSSPSFSWNSSTPITSQLGGSGGAFSGWPPPS